MHPGTCGLQLQVSGADGIGDCSAAAGVNAAAHNVRPMHLLAPPLPLALRRWCLSHDLQPPPPPHTPARMTVPSGHNG